MKKMSFKSCIIAILFCVIFISCERKIEINGSISSLNGEKIKQGKIQAVSYTTPWDSSRIFSIDNGKFKVLLDENVGDMYSININIPDYYELKIPFITEENKSYQCDIVVAQEKKDYSSISFNNLNSPTTDFISFYLALYEKMEEIHHIREQFIQTNNPYEFQHNTEEQVSFILKSLETTTDPFIRELLYFNYFEFIFYQGTENIDANLCKSAVFEISPISPVLSLNNYWFIINPLCAISGEYSKYGELREIIKNDHPHPNVRAEILYDELELAKRQNNEEEYKKLYSILVTEYSLTPKGKQVINRFKPSLSEIQIQKGNRIPSFSFKSIDDPNYIVTDNDMLGKIYMLDFWATWCAPCVAEIPSFQKAYNQYHDQGFEIISVSFDDKLSTVQKFRNTQAMPWFNSFIEKDQKKSIQETFEINAFPVLILIDSKGKIIGETGNLNRGGLEKLLAQIYG